MRQECDYFRFKLKPCSHLSQNRVPFNCILMQETIPFINRPDTRLRSVVYKLIPGLYAKEQQRVSDELNSQQGTFVNGFNEKHVAETCSEDESSLKQYFYDQDEPIR